jgi:3'-5' exoribonuclease
LHYLDDLDAKMQTVRSEFARAEAQGRAPGQMTEWVRALERPLLHTAGYLGEQPTTMEPESEEEANALPAKD